jgi:hypothetical protein
VSNDAAFNAAINFALDEAGPEGLEFLRQWREGAWDEIAEQWPTFKLEGQPVNIPLWRECSKELPEDETPVLIKFSSSKVRIGELRWERPNHEETFQPCRYWDDPENDGQGWEWEDITHWSPIPSEAK